MHDELSHMTTSNEGQHTTGRMRQQWGLEEIDESDNEEIKEEDDEEEEEQQDQASY